MCYNNRHNGGTQRRRNNGGDTTAATQRQRSDKDENGILSYVNINKVGHFCSYLLKGSLPVLLSFLLQCSQLTPFNHFVVVVQKGRYDMHA